MTATMTWVGLDVHARSTHAAAIDRESGELTRIRFGPGSEAVVAWLAQLPQPVHACHEAGPTGYALYRAAEAAGVRVDVVAPTKTPRAAADRIKSDRKDAELLVRLLLAGSLTAVAVPSASCEAARDLALRASSCAPTSPACATASRSFCFATGASTTAVPGRRHTGVGWPRSASSTSPPSSLTSTCWRRSTACAPAGPRSTSGSRCWRPRTATGRPSPGCAAFRGIETLSALVLELEIGDWRRFERAAQLAAWLGLVPSLHQSGESETRCAITKSGSGYARRILVEAAWHCASRGSA